MTVQAKGETFRAQNPPTRTISRAAERYLEQYGDPLVMNTYLKVTILVLALVCLMLGLLVFRSQKALANIHPLVLRIDDVGTPRRSIFTISHTDRKKSRTSITCPAGQNCISGAIATRFSATSPTRCTS